MLRTYKFTPGHIQDSPGCEVEVSMNAYSILHLLHNLEK